MQNVFTEGYDPTADPTISANVASAILQAVRQATGVGITPSTPTGTALVLFGATSPDVVTNPFFATCLWMDQTDPLKPVVRWYNAATPAWETFKAQSSSITADSIADGLLTIAKLASTGGAAHNVIRLKSPLPIIPPYYEFVDPSALFPNNTVNPNVLQIGGSGTYLTSDGVSATWKVLDSATIIGLLANHSIKPTLLEGTNVPYPGTVLFSWGGNVGWATYAQLSELLFTGIKANTQNPNILISGNSGQVLTTLPDGSVDWKTISLPSVPQTYIYDDTNTVGVQSGKVFTWTHGFGSVNLVNVRATLVCSTIDAGYAVGDEIAAEGCLRNVASVATTAFTVFTDKTNGVVGVSCSNYGSGTLYANAKGGNYATLDQAHWKLRLRITN